MLPVNCGSHSDYQNFVVENLRKYYPNPDSIARSTWDIIDRFWNLDLPVFPLLNPASRHDSHGFLHAFFRMKSEALKPNIKMILPSARMVFLSVKKDVG